MEADYKANKKTKFETKWIKEKKAEIGKIAVDAYKAKNLFKNLGDAGYIKKRRHHQKDELKKYLLARRNEY